jgi:hypothetical protein
MSTTNDIKTSAIELAIVEYQDDDQAEDIRDELHALLAEITRLRALLASGQCVDLAKLTDSELGGKSVHSGNCDDADCDTRISFGEDLRQWLLEKAGVKL